ncbi:MAG: YidC/Oxa1 family membrane protein insertase [Candidatus Uhrbacteria bacterium]|nr:YidC/Oxa1 family membrane protein insertase [Candidatus Uhrbacteria bacterium]
MELFHTIFYIPLYNFLVWLYVVLPVADIGLAIIIITVVIKGILFPLTFRSLKSQRDMQAIQPKIKEIREKYKDEKEKMASELMAIYKNNNVNPMASCLPLLIQLPIFIALYNVLRDGFGAIQTDILYGFVHAPEMLNPISFGIIDLSAISIPLAVLAAIAQYFQVKKTMTQRPMKSLREKEGAKDEDMMANMNRMMLYFMPVITLMIGSTSLPGGVMLYWLVTTGLTILLYSIFLKQPKPELEAKVIE